MSSIVQSIQKKGSDYLPMRSGRLGGSSSSLPLSQPSMNKTAPAPTDSQPMQLRRRLSSLSLNLQPISSTTSQYSNSAYSWALHRSKSLSSMGENAGTSVRKWWEWGWSWVMSRKPGFAQDLEMNEEEMKTIGTHGKGSWRHVFYKVGNEFRKLIRSDSNVSLPTSYRYDSKKLYAHSNSAFQKDAAFLARSATVH